MNARGIGAVKFSPAYAKGLVARMKGDAAGAHTAFSVARAQQEEAVRTAPDDASKLCFLGLIDASLGRKEEALREGLRAVELLPSTKDALNGTEVLYFYAVICAWTGERDQAIHNCKHWQDFPRASLMVKSVSIRFGIRCEAIRALKKLLLRSRRSRRRGTRRGELHDFWTDCPNRLLK